jgi:hypothetical protein
MSDHWIVVASADHAQRGRASGFIQACHGKAGPLRRMKPGDGVVIYSPTRVFRGAERLQAFTALGFLCAEEPYFADMGAGFLPARRDIQWLDGEVALIAPLLDRLALTAGRRNWGYLFRFGVLAISEGDFKLIAAAMKIDGVSRERRSVR